MHAQRRVGNRWVEISKLLPGRTDNNVKNSGNTVLAKTLGLASAYDAHMMCEDTDGLRLPCIPLQEVECKVVQRHLHGHNL